MAEDIVRSSLGQGINLYVIPSQKFKTVTISYCFHRDLDEDYTYHALLPAVLKRGCQGLEDMQKIQRYLEWHYGALFDVGVQKKGERQILRFSADVVNEAYVDSKDGVLAQIFFFMNRIINKPLVEDGRFRDSYVDQEKENLKNRILSLPNEKMQYSMERCIQEMCEGEKYSRYVFGNVEDLDNFQPDELFKIYEDMLQTSPLDILVAGSVDPAKIEILVKESLDIERTQTKMIPQTIVKKIQIKEKNITENMDIAQGKLNLGFRTNIRFTEFEYYPLVIYSSILGGGTYSKLFVNVREKASLAYYAFARLEKFKGLMLVGAGIEFDKYEQALEIIMKQLKEIEKGNISDEELENSIQDTVTSLEAAKDQAEQLIDYYLGQAIEDSSLSLDDFVSRVRQVKKDDVVKVAQKVKLDTTYFLRNEVKGGTVHGKKD